MKDSTHFTVCPIRIRHGLHLHHADRIPSFKKINKPEASFSLQKETSPRHKHSDKTKWSKKQKAVAEIERRSSAQQQTHRSLPKKTQTISLVPQFPGSLVVADQWPSEAYSAFRKGRWGIKLTLCQEEPMERPTS